MPKQLEELYWIFNKEYGENIHRIEWGTHIWMIESNENNRELDTYSKYFKNRYPLLYRWTDITTFSDCPSNVLNEDFLDCVLFHHNSYTDDIPIDIIYVIGLPFCEKYVDVFCIEDDEYKIVHNDKWEGFCAIAKDCFFRSNDWNTESLSREFVIK